MPLIDVIEGETEQAFTRRVEQHYARGFRSGEQWVLFKDLLIVAHSRRPPIAVHAGGREEPINIAKVLETKHETAIHPVNELKPTQ